MILFRQFVCRAFATSRPVVAHLRGYGGILILLCHKKAFLSVIFNGYGVKKTNVRGVNIISRHVRFAVAPQRRGPQAVAALPVARSDTGRISRPNGPYCGAFRAVLRCGIGRAGVRVNIFLPMPLPVVRACWGAMLLCRHAGAAQTALGTAGLSGRAATSATCYNNI